jgi:hypothetical protein
LYGVALPQGFDIIKLCFSILLFYIYCDAFVFSLWILTKCYNIRLNKVVESINVTIDETSRPESKEEENKSMEQLFEEEEEDDEVEEEDEENLTEIEEKVNKVSPKTPRK